MASIYDEEDDDPNIPVEWRRTRVYAPEIEPGSLFKWLNPRDPGRARYRLGRLYWDGWSRVVLSFFLLAFGVTFLVIGLLCVRHCDEWDRGLAFFIAGLLMFIPGMYGSFILWNYVRGKRGYSYKMLPDSSF